MVEEADWEDVISLPEDKVKPPDMESFTSKSVPYKRDENVS